MSNYTCDRAVSIPIFQCLCLNDLSSLRYSLKFRVCSSLENQSYIYSLYIRTKIIHGKNVPKG